VAEAHAGDDQRVRLEIAGRVATITLVRERRMNAIDEEMHEELRRVFDIVAGDDAVRAAVLTGSGRAFCAGQDLGERAAVFEAGGQPDLRASLETNYNPLVRRIAELPMPVIAAVNGVAFGAGAALAIACDLVRASSSARFQFGFVNVGLGPDTGASWLLPRLVGHGRALDLALTGRAVTAEDALAISLVSKVVADEDLLDAALKVAGELSERSPVAVAAIKRQMRSNAIGSLDAALDAERDAQAALGQSIEYREAVLRFAHKVV
jgi:2-(1,2-epoxy-1,2-dihydrophenyl)acetyl-CoA isomerase